LYTYATISRLVSINIIKLIYNKERELINFKKYGCNLHAAVITYASGYVTSILKTFAYGPREKSL
jgi:hypothetical protein